MSKLNKVTITGEVSVGGFGAGYGFLCNHVVRDNGLPVLELCSHDYTEFVGCIRPDFTDGKYSVSVYVAGVGIDVDVTPATMIDTLKNLCIMDYENYRSDAEKVDAFLVDVETWLQSMKKEE